MLITRTLNGKGTLTNKERDYMAQTKNDSEVESENFNELSTDTALIEPKQDRLGYAPFAEHLAESICKMNFPEGFIIAVYGSSGSGKSTLLNFLKYATLFAWPTS